MMTVATPNRRIRSSLAMLWNVSVLARHHAAQRMWASNKQHTVPSFYVHQLSRAFRRHWHSKVFLTLPIPTCTCMSTQAYHFCPENCRCLHHRNWILLLLSVGPWGGFLSSVNGTDALKVFSRLLSVGQHHQVLLPFFTQWNSSARSCLHG